MNFKMFNSSRSLIDFPILVDISFVAHKSARWVRSFLFTIDFWVDERWKANKLYGSEKK